MQICNTKRRAYLYCAGITFADRMAAFCSFSEITDAKCESNRGCVDFVCLNSCNADISSHLMNHHLSRENVIWIWYWQGQVCKNSLMIRSRIWRFVQSIATLWENTGKLQRPASIQKITGRSKMPIAATHVITSAEHEVNNARRAAVYQSSHFWDKIGYAKSVSFRFYSAIWRSESRISSIYLEITSISLIYFLPYSRKKELVFWLSHCLNRLTCGTRQITGDSKLGD